MVEDGESKNESHGRCPIDEEQKGLRKNPRGRQGTGRHSIKIRREEMERGREGKTEVKAIGQ